MNSLTCATQISNNCYLIVKTAEIVTYSNKNNNNQLVEHEDSAYL